MEALRLFWAARAPRERAVLIAGGAVLAAMVSHYFFGVPWLLAFISLPLIFVLSVICTNSMALTSWTPTGALSKITQFTMGAIDRANTASNLIPAGMTAAALAAGNAVVLKPAEQSPGCALRLVEA